jgi:hypothetical protein
MSRVSFLFLTLLVAVSLTPIAKAANVGFRNCLDLSIQESSPPQLQFTPLEAFASFNLINGTHMLNLTVYGNVSGAADPGTKLPPPSDPYWRESNETEGKIIDVDTKTSLATTLNSRVTFLNYDVWSNASRFCFDLVSDSCPISPVFELPSAVHGHGENSPPPKLPGYSIIATVDGSYGFGALDTTLKINSGATGGPLESCVEIVVTPYLGKLAVNTLTWIPAAILILVGIATVYAAIFNPWSTVDIFHWSSNSSGGEQVLRLVTPGFGDCLHYLQFIFLTGGLSLSYPGFYQPAVSRLGWSALAFNKNFVSGLSGSGSFQDGIYVTHGDYGLDRLGQLVGLATSDDIWPGSIIWLLVIIAAVTVLAIIDYGVRAIIRKVNDTRPQDLRGKHFPFAVGNVVRIALVYFLLPVLSFSFFQLLEAGQGPVWLAILAAVVLVIILALISALSYLVMFTRPVDSLFDDLTKILCYGPLYNTYSRKSAGFVIVPLVVTVIRAVAVGAVQRSAIAQIILLAMCEIILISTLWGLRPFPPATSMNIYYILMAVVRFAAIILAIAFVPELNITEATKGWAGYIILLIHGIVLFVGFFLNALQTIVEITARIAGAGEENGVVQGGFARVVGIKQLSRRTDRNHASVSQSARQSSLALSHDGDRKSQVTSNRPQSLSGSSAILLQSANGDGASTGPESNRTAHRYSASASTGLTPTTPGETGNFSDPIGPSGQPHTADSYYRRPRNRTHSGDLLLVAGGRRSSWGANGSSRTSSRGDGLDGRVVAELEGISIDRGLTPDPNRPRPDYAVREMDQFYNPHGTLSAQPARRFSTGPANPTSPVSNATGFFKKLFGSSAKSKDKGKGFEVVRGARQPPQIGGPLPSSDRGLDFSEEDPTEFNQPYTDDPSLRSQPYDPGVAIEMINRSDSQRWPQQQATPSGEQMPSVPRKSSRRKQLSQEENNRLDIIMHSPPESPSHTPPHLFDPNPSTPGSTSRLPFFSDEINGPSHKRNQSSVDPDADSEDREIYPAGQPTLVGRVQHHKMHDNTYVVKEGQEEHEGSTVELVDSNRDKERRASGIVRPES